jgi:hypothetical protein
VEALIGKRPFEEKKSLAVEEEGAVQAEDETSAVAKKESEDKLDGPVGGFGLAPSV